MDLGRWILWHIANAGMSAVLVGLLETLGKVSWAWFGAVTQGRVLTSVAAYTRLFISTMDWHILLTSPYDFRYPISRVLTANGRKVCMIVRCR